MRAGDTAARKPGVNSGENFSGHRRLGKGEQYDLLTRARGALRGRIEAANGIDFIAKELHAHRPVALGRVNVENAAAQRVFTRHFDDVAAGVADNVQM